MTTLRTSHLLPLAGWLVGLAVAALLLVRAGAVLPSVPVGANDLRDAYSRDGAALLALTLLRPIALVAIAYQLAITIVAYAGAVTSSTTLLTLSRRAPSSIARTVVRHALGAGLAATAVTSLAPAAAFAQTPTTTTPAVADADPPPGAEAISETDVTASTTAPTTGAPIIMVRVAASGPSDSTSGTAPSGPAVMVSLDDAPAEPPASSEPTADDVDGAAGSTDPTRQPDDSGPSDTSAGPTDDPDEDIERGDSLPVTDHGQHPPAGDEAEVSSDTHTDTWRIEAGDHLWAVAAETLADEWGRAPGDADVLDYWGALLAANRERLIDPANPDLVFPGQVLVLPPVPLPAVIGG